MSDKMKPIFNRVMLNLPAFSSAEPPEPGVAPVIIDGTPIHGVQSVSVVASVGEFTRVGIVFEAEVGGLIAGKSVEDMIREAGK